MTTTVSDAFSAVDAAAEVSVTPETGGERAGAHARMRARWYRSLPVAGRAIVVRVVEDLRDAWWTPGSLPTIRQAWEDRMPDRERVPGGNRLLYGGWVAFNHTVGLAVPAIALIIVGALTVLMWVARHPARVILAALIAAPLITLIFG